MLVEYTTSVQEALEALEVDNKVVIIYVLKKFNKGEWKKVRMMLYKYFRTYDKYHPLCSRQKITAVGIRKAMGVFRVRTIKR